MLSFSEWRGGATEAELNEMKKVASKKFWIYLLISLIPIVNWVTMGMAIFCYNNVNYIKSRGRHTGSNLIRFILMSYAFLLPPIIVVNILSKADKAGNKVLGWDKL